MVTVKTHFFVDISALNNTMRVRFEVEVEGSKKERDYLQLKSHFFVDTSAAINTMRVRFEIEAEGSEKERDYL